MKKYPFSKKAVKAMLVTALAFTPVASFSEVQTQAAGENNVEEYTIEDLMTRFDKIYTELEKDTAGLGYIQTAKEEVGKIDFNSYAKQITKDSNDLNKVTQMAQLLGDIANLTLSSNKSELTANILELEDYRSNIDPLFGTDVTVEDIQNFIEIVEIEYLDRVEALDKESMTKESLDNILKDSFWSVIEQSDLDLLFALNNAVDYVKTKQVILELANDIDPNGDARIAFAKAVKQAYETEQDTSNGGGDGTLSEGFYEVVKETNPSGVFVVTKVLETKIHDIVNQITAEKNIVLMKLEKPAAGEKAIAEIPGLFFTEAVKKNDNAVIEVQSEEASYRLPAKEINVVAFAEKLGVSANDVKITISINVVDESKMKDSIENNNLNSVSKIIEFTVKAVSNDKEELISTFGSYVERDIIGETNFNANHSTAIRLNEDGTFSSIPTLFDGKKATFKSLTNSNYVILENDKTFTDVNNGKSWAEAHIEKLASKYVIKGKTDALYAPKADITRGEFALLISRSLGLVAQDSNSSKFPDVQANKGLNVDNEITAAYEAGLIKGFPDGTFRPNDKITRADASMIIARALEFTNVPDSKFDTTKNITTLKDNASFRYAKDSIEKVYQAGIMEGHETGKFGATEFTTREQMAKVIDKFLQVSNFIN